MKSCEALSTVPIIVLDLDECRSFRHFSQGCIGFLTRSLSDSNLRAIFYL